jgi:hypothetical protein
MASDHEARHEGWTPAAIANSTETTPNCYAIVCSGAGANVDITGPEFRCRS